MTTRVIRQYPTMQSAVKQLVRLGPLPEDNTSSVELVEQYEAAALGLTAPASDEEALALLAVLPPGEWSLFGVAWSLLHFIETPRGWPFTDALDDRGWWVRFLRERAERGGLM